MIPTQNTDEWRAWRKDKIGASDAAAVMGLSPWTTPLQLWEEKLGFRPDKDLSYAMARGVELEEDARRYYENVTGNFVYPHVMIHPHADWCIASLDGITLDKKIICEIKCPGKKTIDMAKGGEIPDHYRCQMQHQMMVCELFVCDYFCYDGENGYLIKLEADEKFISELYQKEIEFMENLKNKTPPTKE